MPRREFLFLQGLAGPFFSHLGQELADRGHGVHRVNFNGGDKIYWSGPNAVDYRLGLARWPRFLRSLLQARSITDIAFDLGFNDSAYFTRCFRQQFGAPPSAWRTRAH